jgi:hypothetical protein
MASQTWGSAALLNFAVPRVHEEKSIGNQIKCNKSIDAFNYYICMETWSLRRCRVFVPELLKHKQAKHRCKPLVTR